MRGKVARELRKAAQYDIKNERKKKATTLLLFKRKAKGLKVVLNVEGKYEKNGIKYDIQEAEKDVCQLHTTPDRQFYRYLKNKYKEFTRAGTKAQLTADDLEIVLASEEKEDSNVESGKEI